MNLNCVNNRINGVDKYCKSEYKLYDNISRNSQYLQIKRDTDAGYNIQNTIPQIKKTNLNSGIEGFTGKIFITDNGPGKTNIKGTCPEGFKWNETLGGCIQVCRNCHYNEINEHKSKDYNKADPCFPEGVYDGISNSGTLNCTCVKIINTVQIILLKISISHRSFKNIKIFIIYEFYILSNLPNLILTIQR